MNMNAFYQTFVRSLFQMCFQKNQTLKEFEEQKQKLLRSEQNLQACQNKEHDVQKQTEVGLPKCCIEKQMIHK